MKLISLVDLKTYLEKSDIQHDSLLDMIIDQVSQRLETALNRKLTKAVYTQKFDAGRRKYYLSAYPIDLAQALTVTIDGVVKTKDIDFYVEEDVGLIEFRYDTYYTKPMELVVLYTGGYAATTGVLGVPDDLKRACYMQCSFDFKRRKDLGMSSITMPDGSVSIESPAELLKEVKAILKSYRKVPTIR